MCQVNPRKGVKIRALVAAAARFAPPFAGPPAQAEAAPSGGRCEGSAHSENGRAVPSTTSFEITTSSTPSRLGRSNMGSSRMASMIEGQPRAPVLRFIALREISARAGLAFDRLAGNRAERLLGERQVDVLHLEQPLVLFYQSVLRLGQDLLQ